MGENDKHAGISFDEARKSQNDCWAPPVVEASRHEAFLSNGGSATEARIREPDQEVASSEEQMRGNQFLHPTSNAAAYTRGNAFNQSFKELQFSRDQLRPLTRDENGSSNIDRQGGPAICNQSAIRTLAQPLQTVSGRPGIRLYTTPRRMWYALTGHEPDPFRIKHLDFVLLSIIAACGPTGIVQYDLVTISGQDKRSVPTRTDRLHDDGYIIKQPVALYIANPAPALRHTSLCALKRFDAASRVAAERLSAQARVTQDVAMKGKRRRVKRKSKVSAVMDDSTISEHVVPENDGHPLHLSTQTRFIPQWTPDRNLNNLIFDLIHRSGADGMTMNVCPPDNVIRCLLTSSQEIGEHLFGSDSRKPIELHLARFVDAWQVSQPLHLRHLAIVRDAVQKNKSPVYIHYSFQNYKNMVDSGQKTWEAVATKPDKKAKQADLLIDSRSQIDAPIFPSLKESFFQGRRNDASLGECAAAIPIELGAAAKHRRKRGQINSIPTASLGFDHQIPAEPSQAVHHTDYLTSNKQNTITVKKGIGRPRKHQAEGTPKDIESWDLEAVKAFFKSRRMHEKYQSAKISEEIDRRIADGAESAHVARHVIEETIALQEQQSVECLPTKLIDQLLHRYGQAPLTPARTEIDSYTRCEDRVCQNVCYWPSVASHSSTIAVHQDSVVARQRGRHELGYRPSLAGHHGLDLISCSVISSHMQPRLLQSTLPTFEPKTYQQDKSGATPSIVSETGSACMTLSLPALWLDLAYFPSVAAHSQIVSTHKPDGYNKTRGGHPEQARPEESAQFYLPSMAAHSGNCHISGISIGPNATTKTLESKAAEQSTSSVRDYIGVNDPQVGSIDAAEPSAHRDLFSGAHEILNIHQLNTTNFHDNLHVQFLMSPKYEEVAHTIRRSSHGVYLSSHLQRYKRRSDPSWMTTRNFQLTIFRLPSLKDRKWLDEKFSYSDLVRNQEARIFSQASATFIFVRPAFRTYGWFTDHAQSLAPTMDENRLEAIQPRASSLKTAPNFQQSNGPNKAPAIQPIDEGSEEDGLIPASSDLCAVESEAIDVTQRASIRMFANVTAPLIHDTKINGANPHLCNDGQKLDVHVVDGVSSLQKLDEVQCPFVAQNAASPSPLIASLRPSSSKQAIATLSEESPMLDSTADAVETDAYDQPLLDDHALSTQSNVSMNRQISTRTKTPDADRNLDVKKRKRQGPPSGGRSKRQSGSTAILRRDIIMRLLESCGGVFPGGGAMTIPFCNEWAARGQPGLPERKTIRNAAQATCDTGRIQQITFSHKDKHGIVTTSDLYALSSMETHDPKILHTQNLIAEHYPAFYIPLAVMSVEQLKDRIRRDALCTSSVEAEIQHSVELSRRLDAVRRELKQEAIDKKQRSAEARKIAMQGREQRESYLRGLDSARYSKDECRSLARVVRTWKPTVERLHTILRSRSKAGSRPCQEPRSVKLSTSLEASRKLVQTGREDPLRPLIWLPEGYSFSESNFEEGRSSHVSAMGNAFKILYGKAEDFQSEFWSKQAEERLRLQKRVRRGRVCDKEAYNGTLKALSNPESRYPSPFSSSFRRTLTTIDHLQPSAKPAPRFQEENGRAILSTSLLSAPGLNADRSTPALSRFPEPPDLKIQSSGQSKSLSGSKRCRDDSPPIVDIRSSNSAVQPHDHKATFPDALHIEAYQARPRPRVLPGFMDPTMTYYHNTGTYSASFYGLQYSQSTRGRDSIAQPYNAKHEKNTQGYKRSRASIVGYRAATVSQVYMDTLQSFHITTGTFATLFFGFRLEISSSSRKRVRRNSGASQLSSIHRMPADPLDARASGFGPFHDNATLQTRRIFDVKRLHNKQIKAQTSDLDNTQSCRQTTNFQIAESKKPQTNSSTSQSTVNIPIAVDSVIENHGSTSIRTPRPKESRPRTLLQGRRVLRGNRTDLILPAQEQVSSPGDDHFTFLHLRNSAKRPRNDDELAGTTLRRERGSSTPVDIHSRPFKKLRRQRYPQTGELGSDGDLRLFMACITVRALTGGLAQRIDWNLVARAFDPDLKLDKNIVRSKKGAVFQKYRTSQTKMIEDFQALFITAYRARQVPQMDFENLKAYDWRFLVQWTMDNLRAPKDITLEKLPARRSDLDGKFALQNGMNDRNIAQYYELDGPAIIQLRRAVINRHAYVNDMDPLMHASLAPEATYPSKSEVRSTSDSTALARSWIRASILTSTVRHDSAATTGNFDTLPAMAVETAIKDLFQQRCIVDDNQKDRSYHFHPQVFQKLKSNIILAQFDEAVTCKARLDTAFREGEVVIWSNFANDGETLAVLNLVASERVKLVGVNKPLDKFGLTDHGYATRQMDKGRLCFKIRVEPTSIYLPGRPLGELLYPSIRQQMHERDIESRLPLWYDLRGRLVSDTWRTVLATVMALLATRPGSSAGEIERTVRPALEIWEIEEVLEYFVRGGFARRVGIMRYTTDEWWWMCLDGLGLEANDGKDNNTERLIAATAEERLLDVYDTEETTYDREKAEASNSG